MTLILGGNETVIVHIVEKKKETPVVFTKYKDNLWELQHALAVVDMGKKKIRKVVRKAFTERRR